MVFEGLSERDDDSDDPTAMANSIHDTKLTPEKRVLVDSKESFNWISHEKCHGKSMAIFLFGRCFFFKYLKNHVHFDDESWWILHPSYHQRGKTHGVDDD